MPTDAERLLWMFLQKSKLGNLSEDNTLLQTILLILFVCQHIVVELMVNITMTYQQYHDKLRTDEIEKLGFNVIRFTNEDIFTKLDNVLETIKNNIS